jgi:transposase InsO family protein
MRTNGLVGVNPRRKWRRGRPDIAPAPDLLRRDFSAARPNQRWVADITEFATDEGKLYVAGVRDLCHRWLVGWAMDEHQDAELVVDALVMALGRCTPDPDGLIHHADRGSQYLSLSFCATANLHGLQVSFGSTGDCFDNAAMETFWSTVKREIRWTRGSDPIHHSTASPPVLVRVVRGVLQPSTPPNRARPPNPDRVRRYVQFAITPCPRKRVKVTATSAGVRWPSTA